MKGSDSRKKKRRGSAIVSVMITMSIALNILRLLLWELESGMLANELGSRVCK